MTSWKDVKYGEIKHREVRPQPARRKAATKPDSPAQPEPAKRSKYGAQKTTVDGIVFDSKKEATRYQELRILERVGQIRDLVLQPSWELRVMSKAGELVKFGSFSADFAYWTKEGRYVVEDTKSAPTKTTAYRLRKRAVEAQEGFTVTEL